MRVVVIGGGFGGMASAARLAKMGHQVTLVERRPFLGGALGRLEVDDHHFDTGPTYTLLPAVVRDLFRKSGRPLERETDLVPLATIREHHFADGTSLRLTGGSRAAQMSAFNQLSPGLGAAWCAYVDRYSDVWDRLRTEWFERPWNPDLAHPEAVRTLTSRETLGRHLSDTLSDPRARAVAAHPHLGEGHRIDRVPRWAGLVSYLEQNFGAWTVPGGIGALGELMANRVSTRKVEVLTATLALDVVVQGRRAVAVRTSSGDLDADAVVCAVDPTVLPSLRPLTRRLLRSTTSTLLPDLLHLGLHGDGPLDVHGDDLPGELVLHGTHGAGTGPDLVLRPGGTAPAGGRAVTVVSRGVRETDVLDLLAARGLDLRHQVAVRRWRSADQLTEEWGGSPYGVQWDGAHTARLRLGPRTPVQRLYAAGAHANPGPGLPFTGLSAWLVAQAIGPA